MLAISSLRRKKLNLMTKFDWQINDICLFLMNKNFLFYSYMYLRIQNMCTREQIKNSRIKKILNIRIMHLHINYNILCLRVDNENYCISSDNKKYLKSSHKMFSRV